MKRTRILLSGDDGYRAAGLRALVSVLRDDFELAIGATLHQQSGTSGALTFTGASWGTDTVDGIPAVWVDAFPADGVEAGRAYFKGDFDLVVTGINIGPNVGTGWASGTVSCAARALIGQIAPHGIAFNWFTKPEHWFREHHETDMASYLPYPASAARAVLEAAVANDFWGVPLLNVNLPDAETKEVVFTRPTLSEGFRFFRNSVVFDEAAKEFRYTPFTAAPLPSVVGDDEAGVLAAGKISITPFDPYFDHRQRFGLAGATLHLK